MHFMKKILFICVLLPILASAQDKVMLVADAHVFAQSLWQSGDAFDEMMVGQRKMLDLSESAFVALVDSALAYHPSLVLIPGDLTKDGELASHEVVVAQLERLHAAGIAVLAIPGNHDISGAAHAYNGAEVTSVDNLQDAEWEQMYAVVYDRVVAKDAASHSYIAEPLPGVSVLGIDASHGMSDGYLSEATLAWVLAQADAATKKGNMLIAMSHWQLLEHADNGGLILESGRLQNADAVRDSLMAHGVRLILTGHMHINSITTYRDTLNISGDSIVEISTGSPITYPCPYRWLTISKDRSCVSVETEQLTALPNYDNLTAYSREWMAEHAKTLILPLSNRMFGQLQSVIESYIRSSVPAFAAEMVISMLNASMPQSPEAKAQLIDKHLGGTVVELYLLHSDGNEPEYAHADSLAQALYAGVGALIHELTDAAMTYYPSMQQPLIDAVLASLQVPVQSLVEDRTHWTSAYYSDCTNDLKLELNINSAQQNTRLDESHVENGDMILYDLLGRRVDDVRLLKSGVYIQNGKKIMF